MFAQTLLGLGLLSLVAALGMTLVGVGALLGQRAGRKAVPAQVPTAPAATTVASAPEAPSVVLEGKGVLPLEPGVLLNTLWEHLPSADCQEGECGGCKVRLLEGQVRWIREPVAQIDRSTHILACSCEPLGPVRCAVEGAVA
jgi:ferredoxin